MCGVRISSIWRKTEALKLIGAIGQGQRSHDRVGRRINHRYHTGRIRPIGRTFRQGIKHVQSIAVCCHGCCNRLTYHGDRGYFSSASDIKHRHLIFKAIAYVQRLAVRTHHRCDRPVSRLDLTNDGRFFCIDVSIRIPTRSAPGRTLVSSRTWSQSSWYERAGR